MMVMFQTGEGDPNRDITTVMHTPNMSEITHCIIITESKCYSINFTKQTVTLYILLSSFPFSLPSPKVLYTPPPTLLSSILTHINIPISKKVSVLIPYPGARLVRSPLKTFSNIL